MQCASAEHTADTLGRLIAVGNSSTDRLTLDLRLRQGTHAD